MPALTGSQWVWVVAAAFIVGLSKIGLGGVLTVVIPLMAVVFGGKESAGLLLPIILIGDCLAIVYFKRDANWRSIRRLMPWVLCGMVIGTYVGWRVDSGTFTYIIGAAILLCAIVLIIMEWRGDRLTVPQNAYFFMLMGIVGGFTTMIGNAAGPPMTVYLLALGMRKDEFAGTYAWLFFIINAIKLPTQMILWRNIPGSYLLLALAMIPALIVGAVVGAAILKRLPEKPFRYTVIGLTVLAAVRVFI
ncbi:anion permease [Clostridia bacterium]|nr:anion permease [Clostridia bacterium]